MKLNTKHQIDPQFSMSSMTDIVFLLLIFFMLTVTSVTPQALLIDLPMSSNATDISPPQVNVMITADLTYYVDHQRITREQLAGLLQQKLVADQRSVLLQVDESVPVAHMIYVTDIAASLHAKVAVATSPTNARAQ
ncbi:MAG: biopolymer transporter ExbD [Amoebophilaceae bacterium]|jgi:biopolymer transport protein ExbD|nr:biopolymer transporter ExbD [Amoebophilaceae bacterium]